MILTLALCTFLGAVLWLDRVFILQALFSRPIVLGPLLGLAAANLPLGLLIGASLELMWLNAPPVGAFLPYDDSFCAAVAVPVGAVATMALTTQEAAGMALLVCLPTTLVGRWIDTRIRTANQFLLPADTAELIEKLPKAMYLALGRSFLYALAAIAVCTFVLGSLVFLLKDALPLAALRTVACLPLISIIIGLAGLITSRRMQTRIVWVIAFFLGLSAGILWTWMH